MNKKDKEIAIRLYERGILVNATCFTSIPEIIKFQSAYIEFVKQQETFEKWLYSDETSIHRPVQSSTQS